MGKCRHSVPGAESASPEAESAPGRRAALGELHLARREVRDALVDNRPSSPRGLAEVVGRETVVDGTASSEFHTPPALNALVIGRNNFNPRAATVAAGRKGLELRATWKPKRRASTRDHGWRLNSDTLVAVTRRCCLLVLDHYHTLGGVTAY